MQPPKFDQNKLDQKEKAQGGNQSNSSRTMMLGAVLLVIIAVGFFLIANPFKQQDESASQESQLANALIDSADLNTTEEQEPKQTEKQKDSVEISSSLSEKEDKPAEKEEEPEPVKEVEEPEKEEITAETYSGADQLSDGVDGYQYGDYINVYRLNERADPSTNKEALSLIQIGATLQIVSLQTVNNRVWGQLASGSWVCLKQDNVIYGYGPGIYQTLGTIPIYSSVSSSQQEGELQAGWRIYITGVRWVGNSVWGLLEDGKAIVLDTDQKSFVTH